MLAEIFMVRLEAAARLQQETALVSSSPFIPFTPNNQFLFKDRAALTAFTPLPGKGQQPPLREGCRAVSKIEYDTAKREYIVISKGGRYLQTGYFLRRHHWWCHV